MRLLSLATGLLVLVGCSSGSVKMSDVKGFGGVKSAIWAEVTQSYEGDSSTNNYFLLGNKAGLCKDLRKTYEEVAPIYEQMYSELADASTYTDYCNARKNMVGKYEDGTSRLFGKNRNYIRFDTYRSQGGYTGTDQPDEGTYGETFEDTRRYNGRITLLSENPYGIWNEGTTCSGDENGYDEAYEAMYVALDDAVEAYDINTGDLEITAAGDNAFKLSIEATLEGEEGEDQGSISLKAKASKCEIDVSGYAYLYF
jgi:hypothetical protein